MFTILPIDNANISSTAATSSDVSNMSVSSSACMFCLETDSLAPSPKSAAGPLAFGTAPLVAPIDITNKEDGEISIEDTDLIPHSPPFSPAAPAKIQITIEEFKELHARPVAQVTAEQINRSPNPLSQFKFDTAEPSSDATSSVPRSTPSAEQIASDVNRDLRQLYKNLRAVFEPQENPISSWEYESEDNWNHDDDSDGQDASSDLSPPEGDATHPPSQWVCGEHPGMGWELNDPFTTSYYRVLIPDPTTNRLIVAPFISYAIQHTKAEVQATYGKGYPIHNRVLQPIPVDYICLPLTPDQLAIFDSRSPFAEAVTKVINQKFPLHLSAAIKRYQYLQEEKYSAQQHIGRLQEREYKYLEKAMCVLSDLENANVLGRIIAHGDDILHSLTADQRAAGLFIEIMHSFEGTITQSAIDARADPFRAGPMDNASFLKQRMSRFKEYVPLAQRTRLSSKERNHLEVEDRDRQRLANHRADDYLRANDLLREAADEIEDTLRNQLQRRKDRRAHTTNTTNTTKAYDAFRKPKKCFRCGHTGHIRATCPRARRPWDVRK